MQIFDFVVAIQNYTKKEKKNIRITDLFPDMYQAGMDHLAT